MKCPACNNKLATIKAGDVYIDICHNGCGGAWFDKQELEKFDEPHEFHAQKILTIPINPAAKIDHINMRECPSCGPAQIMMRRWYDPMEEVEVDQCLSCSGIWLDVGELAAIRNQYETAEDRQAAGDLWLGAHFKETEQELYALRDQENSKINELNKDYRVRFLKAFRELFL